jgi:quercetin dioxygenase-like cupin family protein
MKARLIATLFFIAIFNSGSIGQSLPKNPEKQNPIFPQGQRAPAESFTGAVWIKPLVTKDSTFNCIISNVVFEPGARTNWHRHPAGQILMVIDGSGYYQEKGGDVKLIHSGEVIKCQPNKVHWHGASHDSSLSHIAVNPNAGDKIVEWLEKVSDEEYDRIKNK